MLYLLSSIICWTRDQRQSKINIFILSDHLKIVPWKMSLKMLQEPRVLKQPVLLAFRYSGKFLSPGSSKKILLLDAISCRRISTTLIEIIKHYCDNQEKLPLSSVVGSYAWFAGLFSASILVCNCITSWVLLYLTEIGKLEAIYFYTLLKLKC